MKRTAWDSSTAFLSISRSFEASLMQNVNVACLMTRATWAIFDTRASRCVWGTVDDGGAGFCGFSFLSIPFMSSAMVSKR